KQHADRGSEGVKVSRVGQEHAGALWYLVDDPADRRADDWPALPHAFCHGQAEPLGEALLDDHCGVPLERVDHDRVLICVLERQRDEHDLRPDGRGQLVPALKAFREYGRALRVVGYSRYRWANEQQVAAAGRCDVVGEAAHDGLRVLEPVPPRDLDNQLVIWAWQLLGDDIRWPAHAARDALTPLEGCWPVRRRTVEHPDRGQDSAHRDVVEMLVLG